MRLHLRARPGDVLWLVDMAWPVWVQGMLVVDRVMPTPSGVLVCGQPGKCRWFPHARIGIVGAFTYKQTLRLPPGVHLGSSSVLRMPPELEQGWIALLAAAPLDRSSCYCGECQQFKDPSKFLKGGHQVCKSCRSRIHYERYGKVRREVLRESTDHPITESEWAECKAFFGHSCAYCGGGEEDLTKDHVVSVWRQGDHSRQNIIPACRSCNSKKADQDMEPWYRSVPFFNEERLRRIQTWCAER